MIIQMKIIQNIFQKRPYIPDHPCGILIKGDSGSAKTNPLVGLINNHLDIDKTYLYAKNS